MFTYFIQSKVGGNIKIGKSVDPNRRLCGLESGSPVPLVILLQVDGDIEKQLHSSFRKIRVKGEWFSPTEELVEFMLRHPACTTEQRDLIREINCRSKPTTERPYTEKFGGGFVVPKENLVETICQIDEYPLECNCRYCKSAIRSGDPDSACEITRLADAVNDVAELEIADHFIVNQQDRLITVIGTRADSNKKISELQTTIPRTFWILDDLEWLLCVLVKIRGGKFVRCYYSTMCTGKIPSLIGRDLAGIAD